MRIVGWFSSITKMLLSHGIIGFFGAVSVTVISISGWLSREGMPKVYSVNLLILAAIIVSIIGSLFLCVTALRETWKVSLLPGAVTLIIIGIWGGYTFSKFEADEMDKNANARQSIVAIAHAHNYKNLDEPRTWLYWYLSSVPAEFGVGSQYFAKPFPGKCDIVRNEGMRFYNPDGAFASVTKISVDDIDSWIRGTLAHEFAHCLDGRKSIDGRFDEWTALPPTLHGQPGKVIQAAISDRRLDVEVWKEAVADILQVGYWRLSESPERAAMLTRELSTGRKARAQGKNRDLDHDTSCWVDALATEQGPGNMSNLFSWANSVRLKVYHADNSPCKKLVNAYAKQYSDSLLRDDK